MDYLRDRDNISGMDRLGAIQVFAQVVESGSFAKAAERLGLSTSAASRQVAELEGHLQTRLLNRTTRKVSLTETGRAFYERSVQLLADLAEAEQEASRAAVEPRGTVRLTTSVNFGVRHVAPAIADFLAEHPGVRFDVSLSDRVVDLVEEGFDLGIRIGTPGADNLVARKLGETRLVPCASPAYLAAHGAPATPEDLARHNCFTYEYTSPRNVWRFRDRSGAERAVRVSGTLHSNNGDLLAEAAARGAGVVFEPAFIVGPDVRAGRLVPLLQEFVPLPVPIYAVYPSRKHLSAKVRRFVEFLIARFADAQDWSAA
jgi:DNA-binding transcriptional LysR family regulator